VWYESSESVGHPHAQRSASNRRVIPVRAGAGWVRLGLAFATAATASACTPAPGDSCTVGQTICFDERTKLTCQAGKYLSTPCRGPFGCSVEGPAVVCDISGNAAGDVCPEADDGNSACAPDGTHALRCSNGRLLVEPCHGPSGCQTKDSGPACDHSIAATDQICAPAAESRSACSLEGTHVLLCKDGKFIEQYACRGANGCRLREGRLRCDRSVAVEGEDCSRLAKGGKACSADGKNLLSCDKRRFVVHRPCPKGCRATKDGKLYCPPK